MTLSKILLMRKNSIDENIEILGFDEFCDEYQDLFSNEIEKKREAEKKLLEEKIIIKIMIIKKVKMLIMKIILIQVI